MSFPYDTPTHPNHNTIEEVGVYLEETHPSQYLVFNLSGEQYDVSKLNGQVGVEEITCTYSGTPLLRTPLGPK